jgi:hypothetical protein
MEHSNLDYSLDFLCRLLGVIALIATAAFARTNPKATWMTIPGATLLLFGNLDRVQSLTITAGAVKADLREIRQNVEQNRDILAQIKRLAVANAKLVIRSRESGGALTVVDDNPAQDDFKAQVLMELQGLGLSAQEIDEVDQSDRDIVLAFYAYAAHRFACDSLSDQTRQQCYQAYKALTGQTGSKTPSAAQMVDFFHRYGVGVGPFESYLDDFRYYEANGHQRRPDVWHKRGEWGYGKIPSDH